MRLWGMTHIGSACLMAQACCATVRPEVQIRSRVRPMLQEVPAALPS